MPVRLLLLCLSFAALSAGEAARSAFFNQKVSARTISLNQPVRLELTTVPRQIESVNIEAAVADAVTLGGGQAWRLVGKPSAQIDDKTRTVRVLIVLLPRQVGDAPLPQVPVSWLNGDQIAEFGSVKVEAALSIGSETHPLPSELSGVAGFAWGSKLEEAKPKLGTVTGDPERMVAKPKPGLELVFRHGELVEAAIEVGDLNLEGARASFLARWGSPQIEETASITWILGWTRITAAPSPDGKGMRLALAREDLLGRMTRARITDSVFGLLEAPKPE
ncbi:MAG: hypothetical protein J0M02_02575 [Planctomycetes bacterium]|nr:hypothetical protein [Planctomycetota bacterium]